MAKFYPCLILVDFFTLSFAQEAALKKRQASALIAWLLAATKNDFPADKIRQSASIRPLLI